LARKSRKAATRYSELSKTKKKKQRNGFFEPKAAVSFNNRTEEVFEHSEKPSLQNAASARRVPAAQEKAIQSLARYDYVREDLKRIGILSGAAIVILVILAFVLG